MYTLILPCKVQGSKSLVLRCAATVLLLGAAGLAAAAQQHKVLAPHKPVAPSLGRPKKWAKPMVLQSLVGGPWTIDANLKSTLYLRNDVKTDSVTVTSTLFLSNGVQYTLSPIKLDPTGTAVIDINQALAAQASRRTPRFPATYNSNTSGRGPRSAPWCATLIPCIA
jgi:hypothetical protein